MELLNSLIDKAIELATVPTDESPDRLSALRAAISESRERGDQVDLGELEKAAVAEFEQRRTTGDYSTEHVSALGAVVDVVDAVRAEVADEQAQREHVDALADRVNNPPQQQSSSEPASESTQDAPADDAPATEQPAGEPDSTASTAQPDADAEPTTDDGNGDGGTASEAPAEASLSAAGKAPVPQNKNSQVPMSALPREAPDRDDAGAGYTLTAAADIPGVPMGTILTGLGGLTKAVMGRMQALDRAGVNTNAGVATIQKEQPDQGLVASGGRIDRDVVEYATDERRLPGGSLVASAGFDQGAGWCARPTYVYDDFCPVAVVDGLVDLPSVTAPRGSISWPTSPDFSAIYTQTGFYMPAEEMEKPGGPGAPGTNGVRRDKPCYIVDCNKDRVLTTEPYGLCVKVPILMERAYPELVSNTVANIMAAHAHKLNAARLWWMEHLAQPVKIKDPINNLSNAGAPNAMSGLLGLIELQVQWYRYRHRMGLNATMEAIFPAFIRGMLRSDLAKRAGLDTLDVTDQQLDTYLRSRGIAPQYVLDWQDAYAGMTWGKRDSQTAAQWNQNWDGYYPGQTTPPDPVDGTWLPVFDDSRGDITAPTTPDPFNPNFPVKADELGDPAKKRVWGGVYPPVAWPESVKFLIYPAGSYVQATTDIISIDGLYDSALLARNLHLALFTEEAFAIGLKGCYTPLAVEVPLCPTGSAPNGVDLACPLP